MPIMPMVMRSLAACRPSADAETMAGCTMAMFAAATAKLLKNCRRLGMTAFLIHVRFSAFRVLGFPHGSVSFTTFFCAILADNKHILSDVLPLFNVNLLVFPRLPVYPFTHSLCWHLVFRDPVLGGALCRHLLSGWLSGEDLKQPNIRREHK